MQYLRLRKMLQSLAVLACGVLLSVNVHAAAMVWDLSGVKLDTQLDANGVSSPLLQSLSISGRFTYDSLNPNTQDPNITISAFSFLVSDSSGTLYQFEMSGFDAYFSPDPVSALPSLTLLSKDPSNNDALILEFDTGLNSQLPGGSALLTYALYSKGSGSNLVQYTSSGVGAAVSPVPEPNSVWMAWVGLVILAILVMRKSR